jgi:hypothetical protein
LSRCSWNVRPITIMSFRYTRHDSQMGPLKTVSINPSNIDGALHSPKPMCVNCHFPLIRWERLLILVFRMRSICQYPLLKSRVENHLPPASVYRALSIRASGKVFPCNII